MNMATRQEPQPRLLLVEDDPISRGFLQAVLEGLPAHVDCADSLSSALDRARARRHDLWLIDVNLPDGTGSGLLRALRLLHPDVPALATPRTPIWRCNAACSPMAFWKCWSSR